MARQTLRRYLPERVRRRLRRARPVAALSERVGRLERNLQRLEAHLHESREEAWERSRVRWRAAAPTEDLTWGVRVTGDAFVAKAAQYGAFGPERDLLEIGPGYGRLLAACLERGVEFRSYTGVDISEANLAYLRERFGNERLSFVCGDLETVRLERPADSVLSSLTFKHLFPSFEAGLRNLGPQLADGALLTFDLIEGRRRYFEEDEVTYIRWYTRQEVEEILDRTGFELVGFDEVRHLEELLRLLVVARRRS